jgi:peroxiredoxin Q/BCP
MEASMSKEAVEVGKEAPSFILPDQDGQQVRLEDFRGRWVVLYFYPKDDTPGCTTEACDFTHHLKAFEALSAVVFGCSPDDAQSHRRFIQKHNLRLTLLSDPMHEVMERYGAWGKKTLYGRVTEGVIRSTLLIDPSGKVAHHWQKVKAAGHVAQVRQKLEELQGVYKQ